MFLYIHHVEMKLTLLVLYRKYFELTKKLPKKLNSFYLGNSYKNEAIKQQYEVSSKILKLKFVTM